MKKRFFCLLLCFCVCFSMSAQAWSFSGSRLFPQYGELISYENIPYDYQLNIYSGFEPASDETLEMLLAHIDADHSDGSDMIYDLRIWYSPDGLYQFEVQVKKPTYASFEEELLQAPYYLDLMGDQYDPDSHVRQLHDGRLRKTPMGTMLETAIAYDSYDEEGTAYPVVFVYYDLYLNGLEYCFSGYAFDGDYDTAQAMVDEIVQTVRLQVSLQAA